MVVLEQTKIEESQVNISISIRDIREMDTRCHLHREIYTEKPRKKASHPRVVRCQNCRLEGGDAPIGERECRNCGGNAGAEQPTLNIGIFCIFGNGRRDLEVTIQLNLFTIF